MKIALVGTAPSSIRNGPYADPEWKIWACSPGAYPVVGRSDKWFEIHRWEPPVIGKPDKQKPWFSPEYCMFLARHPFVWMVEKIPDVPNSHAIPIEQLTSKYGHYFFTSTLAYMLALAIEEIEEHRQYANPYDRDDAIGLWGVDMAANEEWGYQRAGCQFFIQIAHALGIKVIVPPESDLLRPSPLYGLIESDHRWIKLLERKRELEIRLVNAKVAADNASRERFFLEGAIDDVNYMMNTWSHEGMAAAANFSRIFSLPPPKSAPTAESSQPPDEADSAAGDREPKGSHYL